MTDAPTPLSETEPRFELTVPDLSAWRTGNTGVEGAWWFDSGRPGRHVLITALVHGNELCGAWALLEALQIGLRPRTGRLGFVFCNLAAFDRFDPADPHASRFVDQDLNRLWGAAVDAGNPDRRNQEQRRASELAPQIEAADWLLDLHSMHEPGPPLGLVGPLPHHAELAWALGTPAWLVADAGHRAGTRLRDHGRFSRAEDRDATALLVECGWHGALGARAVALDVMARFLCASGVVAAEDLPAGWKKADTAAPRLLTVTHAVTVAATGSPSFTDRWTTGQSIPRQGTVIGFDGAEPVRTPYDDCVLVMPSLHHAKPGATLVRLARRSAVPDATKSADPVALRPT